MKKKKDTQSGFSLNGRVRWYGKKRESIFAKEDPKSEIDRHTTKKETFDLNFL